MIQDRPDAHEMLEAMAVSLGELLESAAPEQRFRLRVAVNACALLARETATMAPDRAAQRALAEEIGSGACDERLLELAERLREEVREKVDVAHPGWSDLADDGRD